MEWDEEDLAEYKKYPPFPTRVPNHVPRLVDRNHFWWHVNNIYTLTQRVINQRLPVVRRLMTLYVALRCEFSPCHVYNTESSREFHASIKTGLSVDCDRRASWPPRSPSFARPAAAGRRAMASERSRDQVRIRVGIMLVWLLCGRREE